MSESRSKCDFLAVSDEHLNGVDRVVYAGRRGTGKSTAIKRYISEGRRAIWMARTKDLARTFHTRFVTPATANILPEVELMSDGDLPEFGFGDGAVRVVPYTMITALRDTGIDVGGKQAQLIISDEIIRTDGRYIRNEPKLLDDLAGTIGRSGDLPKIVCACNPNPKDPSANPYSAAWFANFGVEGDYEHDGLITRVIGTADCCDCFGRRIGVDPEPSDAWCAHLNSGGDVVGVNGGAIRVKWYRGWLYVGLADPSEGEVFMRNGVYSPIGSSARGVNFTVMCRQAHSEECVLYDSFEAQMLFYALIRVK